MSHILLKSNKGVLRCIIHERKCASSYFITFITSPDKTPNIFNHIQSLKIFFKNKFIYLVLGPSDMSTSILYFLGSLRQLIATSTIQTHK